MANVITSPIFVVRDNIDTDQIIPAQYLTLVPTKPDEYEKLGSYAMIGLPDDQYPVKFIPEGGLKTPYKIVIAGRNFGCGSSREHAPWALVGAGFQAVVSTYFADIFKNNSLKNGLLPIVVDEETHQQLISLAQEDPTTSVTVDLASQTLTLPDGRGVKFPIDGFSKECLLNGVDQLGYLMNLDDQIAAYEGSHPARVNTLA